MSLIAWFREIKKEDISVVGGKGANLGEMYNIPLPVPPGFVVTVESFKKFLDIGVGKRIFPLLETLKVDETERIHTVAKEVQEIILNSMMPRDVIEEVKDSYNNLDVDPDVANALKGSALNIITSGRGNSAVAVRSSATAEDLPSVDQDSHVFMKIDNKPIYDTISNIYNKIGDGTNNLIEVASMQNNEVKWIRAEQIYRHPVKENKLYKIITETGRSIGISKKHSLIVLNPNTLKPIVTSVDSLKGDEMVPVTRNVPLINLGINEIDVSDYIKGNDVYIEKKKVYIKNNSSNWKIQNPLPLKLKLDNDFAYFLGIYCAEGSTYKNNNIGLTNTNPQILKSIKIFFKKIGLYNKQKINNGTVRVYCKALVRFLHETTGFPLNKKGKGRSCKIKNVPNFIFGCDEKIIGSFLGGCFDGDGYINSKIIEYCSTSEKLIGGIVKLLEMLNINFYIGNKNNVFTVTIPSSEAVMFKEKIFMKTKIDKLNNLIKNYNSKKNHPKFMNNIFISSELSKIIKETINDKLIKGNIEVVLCPDCESYIGKTSYYNNKLRYYCKSCGKTFYNLKKNILEKNINYDTKGRFVKKAIPWNKGILNGFFSKRRFIDIMKKNGLNKYAELFNKSILWDKIKKIEEYNYQGDVYDFTVPNVENFAAGVGGIITHNTASFAGQQETYLNIKGADSVVDAVKRCWASLYTPRAIYYRIKNNFPHDKVLIAVVIQKMIHSEVSGVMFTINPATNSDEIVIEAGFGLGDAIVGGEISPDTYIISKNPFNIKSRKISKQEWMYDREAVGGRVKRELTKEKGSRQKISDESILKLAEFAVEIEEHYGKPMDIEWAVENNKTYIVQARPVTTMKKVGAVEAVESGGELLLTGLGASPGVSVGNVKIVSSQAEISKVEHGDVLVAIMTSPDYVPSMERASAIVTDEGGITCFAGDTKVLTNKGFLSMREIHERQVTEEEFLILGYDYAKKKSAWKRVVQIDFRIRSECIRVSVSQKGNLDHNTLDLTSDHKMYTYRNRLLIKKKISEILYDQEALCLLESLPKGGIFLKQDKLAYLMGAILSDGCVQIRNHSTGNPRSGIVTFTQKDTPEKREFVEEVRACFTEFFGEEFSAPRLKVTDSWLSGRHICGSAMDHICSKLYPAQVLTKITQDLSAWAVGLTEASALCFLAGLIDGDGCFYENRLHIYILKENVLQATVLACMRLRILPQVSINRNIHHVQIVERIEDILEHTKRVKGSVWTRDMGTRFFAAKQILGDVVDQVNWKGRLKPYVEKNLLLDYEKIMIRISPMASPELREELGVILNSGLRMQRLKQVQSLGSMEVFNIEVEALDEMEHNYIVFTKKYTPILVSNSHAAIVSRELGIPCVVGTEKATKILHDGQKITVDGFTGKVYLGEKVVEKAKEVVKTKEVDIDVGDLITGTKIYINLSEPEKVEEYKHLPFDGIGLMRTEFIITDYIKEHPLHLIKIGAEQKYIDKLAEGISIVAGAINNKPMTVRFSDFKTNEYKNLEGGSEYEPHEENPMLGWRGVSRYISEEFKEAFRLECKAIVKVRETYKNVHVMLPFVRTLDEVKKVLNILDSEGLRDGSDFHIYLMAEVPSFALLAEDFAELSITGCSIGSNDLTQLILGVDRDSARLGKMGYFDERNEAVKKAIRMIIRGFHKHGKTVSICGQAPSEYEEIVEFLIKEGIDVISLNPDVVVKTRLLVASVERKILLGKIRS